MESEGEIAGSSGSGRRSMVSNAKFEVEKFDGTNNFGMWQCEIMDVLIQQELDITLEGYLIMCTPMFGDLPKMHLWEVNIGL